MFKKYAVLILCGVMFFVQGIVAQEIDPGPGVKVFDDEVLSPVWSPDGLYIATPYAFEAIELIFLDGQAKTRLVSRDDNIPVDCSTYDDSLISFARPCYTPDGSELYFTFKFVDEDRGSTVYTWKKAEDNDVSNYVPAIIAVDLDTRDIRVVKEEASLPCFSDDGNYYAYLNYDHRFITDPDNAEHHNEIVVENLDTGEVEYISWFADKNIIDLDINNNGRKVVVNTFLTDEYCGIYEYDLDSNSVTAVTDDAMIASYPRFVAPQYSPDGNMILFGALNPPVEDSSLYIYDCSRSTAKRFFKKTSIESISATWSPGGTKLAVALELTDSGDAGLYVYDFNPEVLDDPVDISIVDLLIPREYGEALIDIDYSQVSREDTNLPWYLHDYIDWYESVENDQNDPVWSPDGKWIAFHSIPGFDMGVWLVPVEGGHPELLNIDLMTYGDYFISPQLFVTLGFTPDSQEVVYKTTIIDESRGTRVEIKGDGTTSYGYTLGNLIPVIKAVNIYTGAVRLILDGACEAYFTDDGNYLYYTDYPDRYLHRMDVESGETEVLIGEECTLFDINGDGSELLIRRGNLNLEIYSLITEESTIITRSYTHSADFSSDDRYVLYSIPSVYLFDRQTGMREPAIQETDLFNTWNGSLSPDGSHICYVLWKNSKYSWMKLYMLDLNADDGSSITAVDETTPSEFSLNGNYPNPFNPETTIEFSLPSAGNVTLTVYNTAGQRVRELVSDAYMTPGIHRVLWNGLDSSGKPVSSGVYISRLSSGGMTATGRMLLMK